MSKKVTSRIVEFFTVCLFICLLSISASADNHISRIAVDVTLQKDGSAVISQVWQGDFDEGTECYYPFSLNGYLDISDFKVSVDGSEYTTLDTWDVHASFEEKAYKCGLNPTDDGYEVCWGISSYGEHTYNISYTVANVVNAYTDSDGFNFRFINSGMNTTPTDASVTIHMADDTALTDVNTNIWAFGYYGQIEFAENGIVYAYTDSALEYENHMTVMLEFEKGIFTPSRSIDNSFETLKDDAFEGSDYSKDDNSYYYGSYNSYVSSKDNRLPLMVFILPIFLVFLIVFFLVSAIIDRRKFKKFSENVPYFREIPNGGDLNSTYYLSKLFGITKEGNIIGARLLKLIIGENIQAIAEDDIGFMSKIKTKLSMRLLKSPDETDKYNYRLYSLLVQAAGEDSVLQPKELEKYCSSYPSKLRSIISMCDTDGMNKICSKKSFVASAKKSLKALTNQGKNELSEIIGFKKYLLDFSLIAERNVSETVIWRDYMVYAMLLDIADEVAEQLKTVYPQYASEIERFETDTVFVHLYFSSMYSSMIRREQQIQANRSGGSGGGVSFGGGGGFSGGGFGGGTR